MSDEKHAQIDIRRFELTDLLAHPKNPRVHPNPGSEEWEALKLSLSNVYYDPLVVNKRNNMLVSGHLRKKVLQSMGYEYADCVVIDVDEDMHLALLMSANNTQGRFDTDEVTKLLKELQERSFELQLTGFHAEQIDKLLDDGLSIDVPIAIKSKFEVVVECSSEDEQKEIYDKLTAEGKTCRLLTF